LDVFAQALRIQVGNDAVAVVGIVGRRVLLLVFLAKSLGIATKLAEDRLELAEPCARKPRGMG
jgi:hypothetical protein